MDRVSFWKEEIIIMVNQITSETLIHRIYNHVSRIYALHSSK